MEKRFQVFVSSTYEDLAEERQEVMQALLELDCIPSGMELFPAADDDQWTLIKKVIDDCDYYIVILGGRYGSVGAQGISYTRMEYEYAVEQGKPVIAFLHKNPDSLPASKTEKTEQGQKGLEEFRLLVQKKTCKYWSNASELGSVVSRSLIKLIKSNPAVGWVRGNLVSDENSLKEVLKLRKRIDELEAELEMARIQAPMGTEDLSQGQDLVELRYFYSVWKTRKKLTEHVSNVPDGIYLGSFSATWNDIFSHVSPLMIDEATEHDLSKSLDNFVQLREQNKVLNNRAGFSISDMRIYPDDFQTIKIQLRALGLITKSVKQRSVKDKVTYWTLTSYGDTVLTRLRAVRRQKDTGNIIGISMMSLDVR
ncbi:MAG TPA: DUF4062 domain-containing protein [Pyrinomonadaceae bacterium]|jgi:hypothetical protein